METQFNFETHITLDIQDATRTEAARLWSQKRGLKFVEIELARGKTPVQPMITRWNTATFEEEMHSARQLAAQCEAQGFRVVRLKTEVAASQASHFPGKNNYFEFHVKLLIEPNCDLKGLQTIAVARGAHLSKNARRVRNDGNEEHFLTSRVQPHIHSPQDRFNELLKEIRRLGILILEKETEFVVFDSNLALDDDWLPTRKEINDARVRLADVKNDWPHTFWASEPETQKSRAHVFDPALKHFGRGFRLGAPKNASFHEKIEWDSANFQMRSHLLELLANSRFRPNLVLRGSTLLAALLPEIARQPNDLDYVFYPETVSLDSEESQLFYHEVRRLVRDSPRVGELEIKTENIASDSIWTYERAQGRRLVFPFARNGALCGEIQMDVVWGEPLPEAPLETEIRLYDGRLVPMLAASPALSLAWKLLWLSDDSFPQGKDLYDAVLLAENCVLPFSLLRSVLETSEWWAQQK